MRQLGAGILIAIGILIAGASGVCSVAVLFSGGRIESEMIYLVLVFGGIPFAIGVLMIFAGVLALGRMRKKRAKFDNVADIFE